jgi:hypothetical protein
MTLLPVSRVALSIKGPTSSDELHVLESEQTPALAILELAGRVATLEDGAAVDWDALPASEIAAIALAIRQAWIGDQLSTDGECPECAERVDVSFRIGEYFRHFRPSTPADVVNTGDGWYEISGIRFRVPRVADLTAALAGDDSAATLAKASVEPTDLSEEQWEIVDAALDLIAPSLDGTVGGLCPECGSSMSLRLDPCSYVMAELRDLFAGIYYEVHLLARAYGWKEIDILSMSRTRRIKYAHLISEEVAAR